MTASATTLITRTLDLNQGVGRRLRARLARHRQQHRQPEHARLQGRHAQLRRLEPAPAVHEAEGAGDRPLRRQRHDRRRDLALVERPGGALDIAGTAHDRTREVGRRADLGELEAAVRASLDGRGDEATGWSQGGPSTTGLTSAVPAGDAEHWINTLRIGSVIELFLLGTWFDARLVSISALFLRA